MLTAIIAPALLWAVPWAARALGLAGLGWVNPLSALKGLAWAALAIPVVWGSWSLASTIHESHALRLKAADARAAAAAAEAQALRGAVAQQRATLADREKQLALAAAAADQLEIENRKLRDEAPEPHAMVFAADDPWLVGRRAAGAAGAGRVRQKPRSGAGNSPQVTGGVRP